MRIKTLSEINQQFETLTHEDQQSIVGGAWVKTGYGYIDVDISGQYSQFISDNDPLTNGGGSINFYTTAYGTTGSRQYNPDTDEGNIILVGTLYDAYSNGYGTGGAPMAVYYDSVLGGYYTLNDGSTLVEDPYLTTTNFWGGYTGDYFISYTSTTKSYFDDLTGGFTFGYLGGDPVVEVYTEYTGLATIAAQEKAAREEALRQAQIAELAANTELFNSIERHSGNTYLQEWNAFYSDPSNANKTFHSSNTYYGSPVFAPLRQLEDAMNDFITNKADVDKRQSAQALWAMFRAKYYSGEPGEAYTYLFN